MLHQGVVRVQSQLKVLAQRQCHLWFERHWSASLPSRRGGVKHHTLGATALVNRATLSTNASIFNFNSDQPIVDERFERYGSVTSSGAGEFAGVSTDNLTAIFNHRLLPHLFMELAYNLNHRRSDSTLVQGLLIKTGTAVLFLQPFFHHTSAPSTMPRHDGTKIRITCVQSLLCRWW